MSGGPAQNICDAPAPIAGGTWNRDGVILFSGGGVLKRVLAAGGQPTAITELDQSKQETEHLAPSFLPDGRHYLFLAVSSQPSGSAIYVGSLDSKERTRLLATESKAVYAAPGYILFNRGGTVFAQAFDPDKLALSGEAVRVADGVPTLAQGPNASPSLGRTASFAVSQTGVLAYRTGAAAAAPGGNAADMSLFWYNRAGGRAGQVGTPGTYAGIDLSPDGKQVAVHRHEGAGGDNWLFDLIQGRTQRLTFDATQDNSMPVWSPDGTRIAFGSRRNGKWGLYSKRADNTGSEELITESDLPKAPMSWSPDGKLLVYALGAGPYDVWVVPLTGDRKPSPILQTQFNEANPQISPDGKWLAYHSAETGRSEVYIKPFPSGPDKWQVSIDGGQWPRWRRDGKELYFVQAPGLMAADISVVGSSVQPGVPHLLFGIGGDPSLPIGQHANYHRYAVSADGERFLIPQAGGGGNTVSGGLSDNIAAVADRGGTGVVGISPDGVTVVLNWPQMLKKK